MHNLANSFISVDILFAEVNLAVICIDLLNIANGLFVTQKAQILLILAAHHCENQPELVRLLDCRLVVLLIIGWRERVTGGATEDKPVILDFCGEVSVVTRHHDHLSEDAAGSPHVH